jgi:F-type H+-transporting ATPase subunit a
VSLKGSVIFTTVFVFFISLSVFSADQTEKDHHPEDDSHVSQKEFDPGSFIFDHIADAYEWHIMSIEDKHISIPLPIILYSKYSGFHVFLSSKFHHGHDAYRNFHLELEGPYKGKIVERISSEASEEIIAVPVNISITKNVLAMFFSVSLIFYIFLSMARHYKLHPNKPPRGVGAIFEPVILFVRDDVVKPAIGEKRFEEFLPYLLSLFFFIWINNMLGLIPIFPMGANVTGNISVAAGLAVFTFIVVNVNGNKHYWLDIFNAPNVPTFLKLPIPLMPIIEIVGIIIKPFVLMIRLFANITAGHIITMGFFSLIFVFAKLSPDFGYGISVLSVLFGIFMTMLELLVALIQAYVFTLLTSLYIGAAVSGGH